MSTSARIGTWSLALLLFVAAAGCGGNSFIGRRVDNFTAYYNTFYNARQAYQTGVQSMEPSSEPVDRRRYLSIFGGPPRSGGHTSFQEAIDKSADVLREHPDSKWVDDALILIGKSYFYQENFVGAEQKFREVIALDTEVADEARIWLARTLIAAGALDEARGHLVTSLEMEDVSRRWAPQLHIALGELYVHQESFEEAAAELEKGLEQVREKELEAKAAFLLGQVYETLERYEKAVEAYRRVRSAHPRYELSYAADLSAVRVRGIHVDPEGALEDLHRMERDDKHYANRFELAYVRGRIYQAMGRPDEARALYQSVLYDRESQGGELRGRLHYALGELYEEAFGDYITAAAHFDTARTSLGSGSAPSRGSEAEAQYAPEAITDAASKAEVYGSFASVRREIARADSLLELGALSEEEFTERILEIRRQKARELEEQQRRAQQMEAQRGFQDAASRSSGGAQPAPSRAENTGEAGFLYHRDPMRIQEARMNFVARWGERPHVPNWRRSEAIAAAVAGGAGGPLLGADLDQVEMAAAASGLPPVDYSDVPRDSSSRAALLSDRAHARYELGNVLFLSMNRPDSAAAWYRMVIEEDAEEEVAQRAFYALAEVQRSMGDTNAANRLYEQVLREYPNSDFAGRVREQLGLEQEESSDSLAVAMAEYDAAFTRWRRGFYADAMDRMVSIAASHRSTDIAPKALLAAGRIYLEWAESDSLDVFGPLPVTLSDSVLARAGLLNTHPPADSVAMDSLQFADDAQWDTSGTEAVDDQGFVDDRAAGDGAVDDPLSGNAAVDDVPAGPRRRIEDPDLEEAAQADAEGRQAMLRDEAEATEALAEEDLADEPSDELLGAGAALRDEDLPPGGEAGAPADVEPAFQTPTRDDAYSAEQADSTFDSEPLIETGLFDGDMADSSSPGSDTGPLFASAEDPAVSLRSLYSSVRSQYPATPYARMAEDMLDALEERLREQQAAADSAAMDSLGMAADSLILAADSLTLVTDTVAFAGDSLGFAADSLAFGDDSLASEADSLAFGDDSLASEDDSLAPGGDDSVTFAESLASAADTPVPGDDSPGSGQDALASNDASAGAENIPSGEASLRGEGGIDAELGGFTIVLGTNVQQEPMEALAQRFADRGYRAGLVTQHLGGTTLYRAAVGHFPTGEAAAKAMAELRTELPDGAHVAPLRMP